jgi:hypothetical protein
LKFRNLPVSNAAETDDPWTSHQIELATVSALKNNVREVATAPFKPTPLKSNFTCAARLRTLEHGDVVALKRLCLIHR